MNPKLLVVLALATLVIPAGAQTIFYEPFDNNAAGWTLGTEWGIGAATASTRRTAIQIRASTAPVPAPVASPAS